MAWTDYVTINDDYWPESGTLDVKGHFFYPPDAVLMKIPLDVYLKQRAAEISRSERGTKSVAKSLKDEYAAAGVDVSDEEVHSILGLSK